MQLPASIIKVSQVYLEPLYQRLLKLTCQETVVHMDETSFKVFDDAYEISYFWVAGIVKEFINHQLAIFYYYYTCAGSTVGKIVDDNYRGIICLMATVAIEIRLYPQAKFASYF